MAEENKKIELYSIYSESLKVGKTVSDEHQHGLIYEVNPSIRFKRKHLRGTSLDTSASKIELIATAPTFDKKGDVTMNLDGSCDCILYEGNNLSKIKKQFDKMDKKIRSRVKIIYF